MPKPPVMPDRINVLLVGGGGREHALAWKLRQSRRLGELHTTHPSNPGLARLARAIDVPFLMKEAYRLEQYCRRHSIGLVVVGPEEPLAQGIVDKLSSPQVRVFGPSAAAAALEADKAWAKRLMRGSLIPTAEARTFKEFDAAQEYLRTREVTEAHVVKAAGLAKGKGVIMCRDGPSALEAVRRMLVAREFGEAGAEVVIEETLEGPEVSIFALTDGRDLVILDAAQDHKRLRENDEGPNTGGMGAFSPTPLVNAKLMADVQRKILVPTLDAMRREGAEFRGLLYAGLMLTPAGPKVLEFNVRFGDPECQALMPRIRGDLLPLLWACAAGEGALHNAEDVEWDQRASCCVVLAAPGYPDDPKPGIPIDGVDRAEAMPDVQVFHAGTAAAEGGGLVTAGGRVLNVVGLGATLAEARERALAAADVITFEGKQMRRDIGARAGKSG
ncbi:MAG: phosphoribosylamine--glycine ligase [Planctomycetota bacterium]|nr:phosphoribosylamine--glycine ligase [Planctomycetota bacterium]